LHTSPLFFHIVSKFIHIPAIIYDEIFQALAVEGDVPLLTPIPGPFPPTAQPRLSSLALSRVWETEKRLRGRRFPSDDTIKAEVQKWLLEQDVPFYSQGLENVIIYYDNCLNKFGDYVEKSRTDVQRYPCAFLVSIYLYSRKKIRNLIFLLLSYIELLHLD
jgi:hypothetical protein